MSRTYGDVDRSADPVDAARWMDRVGTYEAIAASKVRSLAVLAEAAASGPVVDVGCGLGEDVRSLGARAIGLDPSRTMLDEAASRGGSFLRGDGARLPFRDGVLAGIRADRVLQHVVDPEGMAAQLVRVVAPGGVVAVTDPDQATLAIVGPDPALAADVVRYRATVGIRNGFLAGRMADVLEAAGVDVGGVERFTLTLTDLDASFGIASWSGFLVERGWWNTSQAEAFDRSLAAAAAAEEYRYVVDIVLTFGHRRGASAGS